jgi:cysteine desulfurase/selenocysteine lyase
MPIDWDKYRSDFPVTQKYTYLDNAAVSPIPLTVYNEVSRFYQDILNYGGTSWNRWSTIMKQTRELYARFIGADSPEEIAFTHSTSEGMNIIAHILSDKGIVVSNDLEFPASNLPWINIKRDNIKFVKARDSNKILIEDIVGMIDSLAANNKDAVVKTILTSHVQYSTGFRQNLEELGKIARHRDLFLVVNSTQSLGAL